MGTPGHGAGLGEGRRSNPCPSPSAPLERLQRSRQPAGLSPSDDPHQGAGPEFLEKFEAAFSTFRDTILQEHCTCVAELQRQLHQATRRSRGSHSAVPVPFEEGQSDVAWTQDFDEEAATSLSSQEKRRHSNSVRGTMTQFITNSGSVWQESNRLQVPLRTSRNGTSGGREQQDHSSQLEMDGTLQSLRAESEVFPLPSFLSADGQMPKTETISHHPSYLGEVASGSSSLDAAPQPGPSDADDTDNAGHAFRTRNSMRAQRNWRRYKPPTGSNSNPSNPRSTSAEPSDGFYSHLSSPAVTPSVSQADPYGDLDYRQGQSQSARSMSAAILRKHLAESKQSRVQKTNSSESRMSDAMSLKSWSLRLDVLRSKIRKGRRYSTQDAVWQQKRGSLSTTVVALLIQRKTAGSSEFPLLNLIMSVIVILNIIIIGVSTDVERDWVGWTVINIIFAVAYLMEAGTKIRVHGFHEYWTGEDARWNLLDFVLLLLAWIEVATEILAVTLLQSFGIKTSLLRLFRLVRITKVLRICRLGVFSDLVMILNGAIGSAKTLIYSVVLINIPLYVVSLLLNGLLEDYDGTPESEAFDSLAFTFFNMFRCTIANECTASDGRPIFVRVTTRYGWHYGFIYCVTVMLMTFGLFNVIVAIYVENIVSAAKVVGTRSKRKRLMDKKYFQDKILELLRLIQEVRSLETKRGSQASSLLDFTISPDFLDRLFTYEDFLRILQELDIADEDMVDLFETLDVDGNGEVDMEELIIGIFKLRGDGRRADIIAVSLVCRSLQDNVAQIRKGLELVVHQRSLQHPNQPVANLQVRQQSSGPSSQPVLLNEDDGSPEWDVRSL